MFIITITGHKTKTRSDVQDQDKDGLHRSFVTRPQESMTCNWLDASTDSGEAYV